MQQLAEYDYPVFGRATYEGMAQYWPSDEALRSDGGTAEKMLGHTHQLRLLDVRRFGNGNVLLTYAPQTFR
jgi:hypothetical protein